MRLSVQGFIIIFSLCFFALYGFIFHANQQKVFSISPNIVISEIQLRSTTDADDEFIELYNPTGTAVDINGWKLTKRTQSGTQTNLIASMSGIIPAKGYFLITSPESASSPSADQLYTTSQRIAVDNTVTLLSNDGTTVIDLVGFGTATINETTTVANPTNGGSVERKAQDSSSTVSMETGGIDELSGNGWDTDNNSVDFIQRTVSQPQSSLSPTEPSVTPTPSEISPTVSPTNTPTSSPNPTIEDTPTPTVTIIPTITETPIPTPTENPTPTNTPSATPTATPINTPIISATPSPTTLPVVTNTPTVIPTHHPTITPTPIPTNHIPMFSLICTSILREIKTPFGSIHFSIPSCKIVKIKT